MLAGSLIPLVLARGTLEGADNTYELSHREQSVVQSFLSAFDEEGE